MNARVKLNSANFNGILIVSGLVGWTCSSWPVFLITAIILTLSAWHSGHIRSTPGKRD